MNISLHALSCFRVHKNNYNVLTLPLVNCVHSHNYIEILKPIILFIASTPKFNHIISCLVCICHVEQMFILCMHASTHMLYMNMHAVKIITILKFRMIFWQTSVATYIEMQNMYSVKVLEC